MVLGCLRIAPLREHTKYIGQRMRPTLYPPTIQARGVRLFAYLRRAIPKLKEMEARKNAWILEDTWRLVNKRVSARQDPAQNQSLLICPGRAINMSLKEYMRWRTEEARESTEKILGAHPPSSIMKTGII